MPKRPREDFPIGAAKRRHIAPQSAKRKWEADDLSSQKRQRVNNLVADDLRRRNFELEQMVESLCNKIKTLEYKLQMFQRNETIGHNQLVRAY